MAKSRISAALSPLVESEDAEEFDGEEMWLWLCLYTEVCLGGAPDET